MVMSQAAIDALMTQNAAEQDEAEDDGLDAIVQADEKDAVVPEASQADATPAADADVDPLGDSPAIDEPLGALSDEELAAVKALAADDSIPVADIPQSIEAGDDSVDAAGVKMRRWSASSTSTNDQIKERVQDLEDKLTLLEANGIGAQPAESVDPQQLVEMKQTLDALTASVQGIAAALQQLTEASQASLGFAAKQTFDCPECQSHGTVSVPITCTYCGFESEWGFYPEQ